jgi:hypothetical protein
MKHKRRVTAKNQKGPNQTGGNHSVKRHTASKPRCNILDTRLRHKSNNTWKTCIRQHGKENTIYYITPINAVIKSISTYQIPEFVCDSDGKDYRFKIRIDDQYISCFLLLHKRWYAITIMANTYLHENMRFYHVNKTLFTFDNDTGKFTFAVKPSANQTIDVTRKYYSPVAEGTDIRNILDNFALQKILGNMAKKILVEDAALTGLEWAF